MGAWLNVLSIRNSENIPVSFAALLAREFLSAYTEALCGAGRGGQQQSSEWVQGRSGVLLTRVLAIQLNSTVRESGPSWIKVVYQYNDAVSQVPIFKDGGFTLLNLSPGRNLLLIFNGPKLVHTRDYVLEPKFPHSELLIRIPSRDVGQHTSKKP